MSAPRYVPVMPREHAPDCRRTRPEHPSIDRERCPRCRALWERMQRDNGPRAGAVRYRP